MAVKPKYKIKHDKHFAEVKLNVANWEGQNKSDSWGTLLVVIAFCFSLLSIILGYVFSEEPEIKAIGWVAILVFSFIVAGISLFMQPGRFGYNWWRILRWKEGITEFDDAQQEETTDTSFSTGMRGRGRTAAVSTAEPDDKEKDKVIDKQSETIANLMKERDELKKSKEE
jgi:hypothetical protein